MTPGYRYPWPSSQLTAADMRLLHEVREARPDRPPITQLLAEAVRAAYGHSAAQPEQVTQPEYKPRLLAAA